MVDHILVAYASGSGSTAEVAHAIADMLRSAGQEKTAGTQMMVDVKNALEILDLSPYSAVVIGSSIRAGRWLPEAIDLVERFQSTLRKMPVAYFTTCLTMVDNTVNSRRIVLGYMEPILNLDLNIRPVGLGLFAGSLYPDLQPILPGEGGPYGDFRDWEAISDWARTIHPRLLSPLRDAEPHIKNLRGAILSFSDLSGAKLDHVDLQEAQLQETDLTQAGLHESKLSWSDLTSSSLVEADLSGASLIGSILNHADLSGANLQGAILNGVQLQKAKLTGADLRDADLNWANLTDADLSMADCRGLHLGWSNLEGVNLTGCDFRGAIYNSQTHWPANFDPLSAGCIKH